MSLRAIKVAGPAQHIDYVFFTLGSGEDRLSNVPTEGRCQSSAVTPREVLSACALTSSATSRLRTLSLASAANFVDLVFFLADSFEDPIHRTKDNQTMLEKVAQTRRVGYPHIRNPRVLLLVALIAGTPFAVRHFGSQPLSELLQWISALRASAPLVFIPLYVAACVFFIPGSILTLSAGFLFGVVRGSMYVSVAATLGATLAFLIGRYFARQWVAARLANYPKFKAIDEAVAQEG